MSGWVAHARCPRPLGDKGPAPGGPVARRPRPAVRVGHQGPCVVLPVPRQAGLGGDPPFVPNGPSVLLAPAPRRRVVDVGDRRIPGPPGTVILRLPNGSDVGVALTSVVIEKTMTSEI